MFFFATFVEHVLQLCSICLQHVGNMICSTACFATFVEHALQHGPECFALFVEHVLQLCSICFATCGEHDLNKSVNI